MIIVKPLFQIKPYCTIFILDSLWSYRIPEWLSEVLYNPLHHFSNIFSYKCLFFFNQNILFQLFLNSLMKQNLLKTEKNWNHLQVDSSPLPLNNYMKSKFIVDRIWYYRGKEKIKVSNKWKKSAMFLREEYMMLWVMKDWWIWFRYQLLPTWRWWWYMSP